MIFVQCYNALDSEARGGDDGNGGPMKFEIPLNLKGMGSTIVKLLGTCYAFHGNLFAQKFQHTHKVEVR